MAKVQVNSQGKAYLTTGGKALVASSSGEKYGANINTFIGDVNASGVLQPVTEQSDIVFTGVTNVAEKGLTYRFAGTNIKSISFPSLITISGIYACFTMARDCTSLTSVSFPSLTTISGRYGCGNMLQNCTALTSVSFPSLTTISGSYACNFMFQSCKALTDVYFPALTTTSFGSNKNQFSSMMSGTGTYVTHTLHFPSNLESKIRTLTGYPTFGGTSGYVVLSFDLPQTN